MSGIVENVGWSVPAMNEVVNQTLNWTQLVGAFLASSFLCVKYAWEYFRYSYAQGGSHNIPWDWNEVIRVIFIVGLLGIYKPLATSITDSIGYVNSLTQKDSGVKDRLELAANKWYVQSKRAETYSERKMMHEQKKAYAAKGEWKKVEATQKQIERSYNDPIYHANGSLEGTEYNRQENIDDGLQHMQEEGALGDDILSHAVSYLTIMLAGILKWAIGTFYSALFQLCICFGPIVLAFGIFFRDKPINYFNYMLNIGLTFTTLNIIDMLMLNFAEVSFNNPSMKESLAFNMAIIGMYWSAGKITKWYIGETGINSIMQRGVQQVTTGAAIALGLAGGAASAGMSTTTSGAASSASNTASNILNKASNNNNTRVD